MTMNLDDLKNTWKEAQGPAQDPQPLNPETLESRSARNFRSRMKKIMVPEIAGGMVCLAAAAFIALRFDQLDTVLLRGAGVLSILLLVALPLISTLSTWKLNQVGNLNHPYGETLKQFALQKIRFIKLQKLNVALSYLLLVVVIVLLSKLLSGEDLSGHKYFWLFSFPLGFIFLLFYSRWVEKYYRSSLQQAEELLKELTA